MLSVFFSINTTLQSLLSPSVKIKLHHVLNSGRHHALFGVPAGADGGPIKAPVTQADATKYRTGFSGS